MPYTEATRDYRRPAGPEIHETWNWSMAAAGLAIITKLDNYQFNHHSFNPLNGLENASSEEAQRIMLTNHEYQEKQAETFFYHYLDLAEYCCSNPITNERFYPIGISMVRELVEKTKTPVKNAAIHPLVEVISSFQSVYREYEKIINEEQRQKISHATTQPHVHQPQPVVYPIYASAD